MGLIYLLFLISFPLNTWALTFGKINIQSTIGQPLKASIPLQGREEILKTLKVNVASEEEFEHFGINKHHILSEIDLNTEIKDATQTTIHLNSNKPLYEPVIKFLLKITSDTGTTFRLYTLLLDPNDYGKKSQVKNKIEEVVQNTQSFSNAQSVKPPAQIKTIVKEFNKIKTTQFRNEYGPIKQAETLWSIAKSIKGQNENFSIKQMMLSLLKANPKAFNQANIHGLKAGYILVIPSLDEVKQIDPLYAEAEVKKYNQSWASLAGNLMAEMPDIANLKSKQLNEEEYSSLPQAHEISDENNHANSNLANQTSEMQDVPHTLESVPEGKEDSIASKDTKPIILAYNDLNHSGYRSDASFQTNHRQLWLNLFSNNEQQQGSLMHEVISKFVRAPFKLFDKDSINEFTKPISNLFYYISLIRVSSQFLTHANMTGNNYEDDLDEEPLWDMEESTPYIGWISIAFILLVLSLLLGSYSMFFSSGKDRKLLRKVNNLAHQNLYQDATRILETEIESRRATHLYASLLSLYSKMGLLKSFLEGTRLDKDYSKHSYDNIVIGQQQSSRFKMNSFEDNTPYDDKDLSAVVDEDVIESKLSLATTYINMGNNTEAIKLLNEIARTGTQAQCKEAKNLLKSLKHI